VVLLRLGADAHDRRRDRGDGELHAGGAGQVHLFDEDVLLDRGLAEAAEFLRPAHAPPAALGERALERLSERAASLVAGDPHRAGVTSARRKARTS